ncbi:MAG: alpha/beta hydrolase [Candidatus Marinimicrobia bacterium]|nr:alpha/beta hydrolase [Candidatus Neomarinimicrobiota bacterium]MBL7010952.1 alpha/beta hydrolase [Candidatus Neomarinimicrobiota bacterium]MBL7031277.1 alpha/beta hydrolase [Candidatus Neomarinimicrobiota bacterium]
MSELHPKLIEWKTNGEMKPVLSGSFEVFCRQIGNPNADSEHTALILHGFPESSFSYHSVIEGLKTFFDRIILFDFLGFGQSDKPIKHHYNIIEQAQIALNVWQSYGVKGGHLIAHDMGDSVAAELITLSNNKKTGDGFRNDLQSVTFTNGGMVIELAQLRILQKLMLNPILGPLLSKLSRYKVFKQQVFSANGNKSLAESDIEIMWLAFRSGNGNKIGHKLIQYINDRYRYQNSRWLPALKETTIPIHLCWGELDAVAPIAIAEKLMKDICPKATFTRMDNTGHFCQMDNPDKWIESVLNYYRVN